jgi:hypothetical protein
MICLKLLLIVWTLAYMVMLLLSPKVSARNSEPSFVEEGFQRGQTLLESDKWQAIEDGLWWHTFREYSVWPYFMYSVCTKVPIERNDLETAHPLYKRNVIVENASCSTLLDIEVYHYPTCSRAWIPQLLQGKSQDDTSTQYLEYNFFPFQNRDVCQSYHLRQSALWTSLDGNVIRPNSSLEEESIIQVFIETTTPSKEERCKNKDKPLWMYEDVHKFFYPDVDEEGEPCNRMIYIGVEDPRGNLYYFRGFLKYVYRYFYQSHFAAYKTFLHKIVGV